MRTEPVHDTLPLVDEVERLVRLRDAGATSVSFHPTGELASVTFGPAFVKADHTEEEQRDPSAPEKRPRRSTGGLIPRGPTSE